MVDKRIRVEELTEELDRELQLGPRYPLQPNEVKKVTRCIMRVPELSQLNIAAVYIRVVRVDPAGPKLKIAFIEAKDLSRPGKLLKRKAGRVRVTIFREGKEALLLERDTLPEGEWISFPLPNYRKGEEYRWEGQVAVSVL